MMLMMLIMWTDAGGDKVSYRTVILMRQVLVNTFRRSPDIMVDLYYGPLCDILPRMEELGDF